MPKQNTKLPVLHTNATIALKSNRGRTSTVKFGSVTISGAKPAAETISANVALSTQALERVGRAISKPGIVLRPKAGVPLFKAATGQRGVYIRTLNGKIDFGQLVNGKFRVID